MDSLHAHHVSCQNDAAARVMQEPKGDLQAVQAAEQHEGSHETHQLPKQHRSAAVHSRVWMDKVDQLQCRCQQLQCCYAQITCGLLHPRLSFFF